LALEVEQFGPLLIFFVFYDVEFLLELLGVLGLELHVVGVHEFVELVLVDDAAAALHALECAVEV